MPGRDGTGPAGPGKGSSLDRQFRHGVGGGRMGEPAGAGPEGFCECPKCSTKVKHQRAVACSSVKCSQCGSTMIRA